MHFLDRTAKYILAILYSSEHIDITMQPPNIIQPQGKLNSAIRKAIASETDARLDQLKQRMRMDEQQIQRSFAEDPVLAPLFRYEIGGVEETTKISEIDADTVAVTVVGGELIMACNYKRRRNKAINTITNIKQITTYEYHNFNSVSDASFGKIRDAVRDELRAPIPLTTNPYYGENLIDQIQNITFIGTIKDPSGPDEAASYHAEMQLLSYLLSKQITVNGLYFGVSKECCSKCYPVLDQYGIRYANIHNRDIRNWISFNQIRTRQIKSAALYPLML